jgi:L-asparagine transporter-like permease
MAQVIAVGAEAVAAGLYMTFYFPGTPVWMWSLGFAFVLLYFNSRSVNNFGSIEYWFALIKVVAIVIFIILGTATIFGLGTEPVGFHNLTGLPGGFMPKGFRGVWLAVILGVLSFNGIEVIAVTSGEAKDPVRTIPAALRTMALRLFLFYILALTIVVTFVPWTETGATIVTQSPFVRIFAHSGIRHAAGIMNFVVLSAALSSMNTNVYLCSRMLFSLSRGGFAPQILGRLGKNGTPIAAILVSGVCILAAAGLEAYAEGVHYLFRWPFRCDDRVDHHSVEPFEFQDVMGGRPASAHARISSGAARRLGFARRDFGDHGLIRRSVHLLGRRCSLAAVVGRVFHHEGAARAQRGGGRTGAENRRGFSLKAL